MHAALRPAALACLLAAPGVAQARDWRLEASMSGRYGMIPDALLDKLFDLHGSIRGLGPGVELGWTRDGFHALAVAELVMVTTPDQIWLEKDAKKVDAVWVENDLRILSYGLIFGYEWRLVGPVSVMPAIGFVPVHLKGALIQFPTDGGRDTPAEDRTKGDGAKGSPIRMPMNFNSSDLGLRIRVQPSERWFLSLDGGWRMMIYAGLTTGAAF